MNTISVIEFNRGNKIILYKDLLLETEDMRQIVRKIVGDKDLETIKAMPLKRVQKLVREVLEGKGLNLD